ncbi:S-adenosyl-L-methionine-dependent methyltransferase [Absidia repens]|uniref:S-adenosyl-L-methionine-dependent methyltransferase n=1 Tax=Absidia repens TaxID=90262 RepID=A0A1X2IRF7_9FUNG|nr:S-adenosyl-L-methionine-dependent methyltransferase [Absidia repens]
MHRRSAAINNSGSQISTSGRIPGQQSLKPKSSFIRPSTSGSTTTNDSSHSSLSKQQHSIHQQHQHNTQQQQQQQQHQQHQQQQQQQHQQQQQQQQISSVPVARPPIFAGLQSNSFFLPKNWQAEDADHGLHFALKQLFASNVLSLVLPKFTRNAYVIEIGCGHGFWILEMATQFPDCQFIGFDTSMDRLPDGLPPLPNVNFQVANVVKDGILLKDESVDVVNLRAQNTFMDHDSWRRTFEEAHRVLKPGVRGIMTSLNRDTDRATKLGPQLSSFEFQVIQSLTKKVFYGSSGKLGEAFTAFILHRFEEMATVLAPAMGLSLDDYRHRVEMVVAQSVNANSVLTWYAYAARKVPSS